MTWFVLLSQNVLCWVLDKEEWLPMSMGAHASNPRTLAVEVAESGVQRQPPLHESLSQKQDDYHHQQNLHS